MGKIEKMLVVFLTAALLVALAATFLGSHKEEAKVYTISVVLNDTSDVLWEKFEKGVAQAALEYNADVNIVTLYNADNTEEQITLMEREVSNGAGALIVAPAGKEEMEAALERSQIEVPIILVEGTLDSAKVQKIISADQEKMGYDLGMAMKADDITKCVIYTGKGKQSYMTERLAGLKRACDEAGIGYTETKEQPETYFWRGTDGVVALNEELTEELCAEDIYGYYGKKVYGVGSSSSLLRYLDNGEAEYLAVVNSYDEGYLSLQAAVQQMDKKKKQEPEVLEFYGIRRDMIYEKKYQKLLFPLS